MRVLHGAVVPLLALASSIIAAEPTKEQTEFFNKNIAPIFSDRCYKCHSAAEGKTKGGLALDTRDAFLKGGDDGKIVVPGDPAKSPLIQRVLSKDADEKMPPKAETLDAAQVAALTTWVKMGAPFPATAAVDNKAPIVVRDTSAGKKHWAWQPIRQLVIPTVAHAQWVKTPVDNYIASKLERSGITPGAPADRATLIRRAYFDLVGLPPMPWEVQSFIDDKAPNAWEKVIDRLLASPHYGERWGRYWLDVARYSDTKGDNAKKESPLYVDAWTYRDYVVDAFNRDKPYDRFVTEQIAADKMNLGQDKRPLAALGFLTVGDRFNGNKNDIINDRISVVSKGFLGLTVECARCHDHMFDPIPQKDYYSLHGIFASTVEPKDNPIITAQGDAQQYQSYLKAREEASQGAKQFLKDEYEKAQKTFRQHAGDLLMAARTNGADRQKYVQAVGLPPKQVDEFVQMIRRGNPAALRRSPIFSPFARFSELPPKQFAQKSGALCTEIANGTDRRFPVNSIIATAFRGKNPASMDEVVGIYNDVFKEAAKKAETPETPGKMASGISSPAGPSAQEELLLAPFTQDPMKDFDVEEAAKSLPQRLAQRYQQLMSAVTMVEMTHPGAPKRAMVMEDLPKPQNSPVFIRGEAGNRGEIAPRRFLEILSGPNRPEFKIGSGRLELAQAIAARSNPLTPRVMVNRIWLHHFGEGIVTTPDDFGTMSAPPSHPELLDYLAARFMQSGWSVKTMHKLIMMSSVYQQKGEANDKFARIDPNNRLLWHYQMRRLEFEPLRDSLLYIAGELDLKVGGQPVNILSEPYSMRRSVYGYIDRRNLPEMMNHFDFANPGMSTGKRHETTVPQQALFMMNSPLMVDVARKLLARPEMSLARNDSQRVHALYWMIYQRPPKPAEIELGLGYLKTLTDEGDPANGDASALAVADAEKPADPVADASANANAAQKGKAARAKLIAQRKAAAMAAAENRKGRGFALVNPGERVDRKALTPWEKYTHALLMANEMVYYN